MVLQGRISQPSRSPCRVSGWYSLRLVRGSFFVDLLSAGYNPHDVSRLYIHWLEKPDTWIDTKETIEIKIEALKKHGNQFKVDKVGIQMRVLAKKEATDKEMKFAESYKVMILQKDTKEEEANRE